MSNDDYAPSTYTQLLALCRQTFASGHYATAFHALAGAMHYAADVGNDQCLREVAMVAQDQLAWMRLHEPDHLLSPRSSQARGTDNLWESLTRQAETKRLLLLRAMARHGAPSAMITLLPHGFQDHARLMPDMPGRAPHICGACIRRDAETRS